MMTGLVLGLVTTGAFALPAFPGAEGFGSETPGGRGGRVIAVTTLADSGPGSLREAVTAEGPRMIVFHVGGAIHLKSHLRITEPFVTIAGQTAPGDGIMLRDAGLYIQTHDVVVRFLRSRVGPSLVEKYSTQDALQISNEGRADDNELYNIVVDHCSFSWSIDECVGIRVPAHDVTFSWNIVSEALRQPFTKEQIGKDRSHSMSLILSGGESGSPTRCSLHHNLLALCNSRNPRIQGGRHDFVNNVVYGWGWLSGTFSRDPEVNFVGNYYKPGPGSMDLKAVCEQADDVGRLYVKGNRCPQRPNDALPEWDPVVNASADEHMADQPFDTPSITTTSAQHAYDTVLSDAGATLPRRDEVDRRVIRYTRLGMGEKIDRPDQAGGYPDMLSGQPLKDTDCDGIPDDYEIAHGFDPHDSGDGKLDADGDGYTNLEQYLNGLVQERQIPRPAVASASAESSGGAFIVTSLDRKLTVVPVGDGRTFYSNVYFEDEITVEVAPASGVITPADFGPPRFVDHLELTDAGLSFRVCEPGTRVIRQGDGPDALSLLLFFNHRPDDAPQFSDPNVVDARKFGIGGGLANITDKLQAALEAASKIPGGGVVWIPDGEHEIDTVRIPSNATLYVAATAVLHASPQCDGPMILFDKVENAGLTGPGCIVDDRRIGAGDQKMVVVRESKTVTVSHIVLRNRADTAIEILGSDGLRLSSAKIAASSPDVNGLFLESSKRVDCEQCFISGGYGVSVVSSKEQGTGESSRLTLRESLIWGKYVGLAVDAEASTSIRDLLCRDVDIAHTATGIRVHSHGGGRISQVVFRDMTIALDPRLAGDWQSPGQPFYIGGRKSGQVRDVLFDRVVTNATASSVLEGEPDAALEDVRFWGVRIQLEPPVGGQQGDLPPPLFDLDHVKRPQFRFLYVTWPEDRQAWGPLFDMNDVTDLKAPESEIFEQQAGGR